MEARGGVERREGRRRIGCGEEDVGAESGGPLARIDVVLVRDDRVAGVEVEDLDAVFGF